MIVLVYVNDCIIVSDSQARINMLVHSLKNGKEKFILTKEDTIDKFLGISITQLDEKRFELSQPFPKINGKQTVTPVGKPLLHKILDGKEREHNWNYCTAVGMTGYLQGNTRSEISMANHQ